MFKKIFSITLLLCVSVLSLPSTGAETVFTNDPVIISATRYETSVSREGKDISVITDDDIKKSGKKNLADVLEGIPGLTITRAGADGGITKVYMRGSKSANVLVMIDGVRISDPVGIEKLYDISGIMTSNIERIEIVRGAMSAMYGAEASGGVINVITKKGTGQAVKITGEAGAYNTFIESLAVSDTTGKSSFLFSASHNRSGGVSKAKKSSSIASYDDDSFENVTVSGKMESKFNNNSSLNFAMNYTDSELDSDDGSYQDDPNHVYSSRLFTSRGEFRHSPFSWWTYKGGVSLMSYVREDVDPADAVDTTENDTFTYNGSNTSFDFISIFNIMDISVLSAGAELLKEKGSSSSNYGIAEEDTVDTLSVFINDSVSLGNIFFINAGGRGDNHEAFGTHYTWDASAAVVIPYTGTKLKASAGTGFRAPSLYELYDSYSGNAELDPEKTFVYDAGIYQELFDGAFSIDCTYFTQKYTDMIDYNYTTWRYYNAAGEIKNRGVEIAPSLKIYQVVKISYSYTYMDYIETGSSAILKRPAHKHTASVNITPFEGFDLTVIYLYTGKRYDYLNATSDVKLDPYHKVDINIRYALNEMLTFTARGENLADTDYEETRGYNTRGRSFYGGVEVIL